MMKNKKLLKILLPVAAVLLLLGAAVLIQHLNNWRVDFEPAVEAEVFVECPGAYRIPEVSAVFRGDFIEKDGTPLEVTQSGTVDAQTPGDYVLEWTAYRRGEAHVMRQTVHVVDTTPPEITLVEETREYVLPNGKYDDPGYTATDAVDGDLTDLVSVELTESGAIYTVTDSSGNSATVERAIPFDDPDPPQITLKGDEHIKVYIGVTEYKEPGFSATDECDGDLTDKVTVKGEVDSKKAGEYEIEYTVSDRYENEAKAVRKVTVAEVPAPELILSGSQSMTVYTGASFTDPGWSASHEIDGDLTDKVEVTGSVDTSATGTYTLKYTVSDKYGHTVTKERTVTVAALPTADGSYKYTSGGGGDKVIYLTFDDGPSAHTARLLDILDKYGVKATFFVVSYGYEDMIGEAFRRGHSIGVHSVKHDFYNIYASEEAFFADLQGMNEIVRRQTGYYTNLIRFPGGSSNTISRFNPGIMTRLAAAVTQAGYVYFDWNVGAGDAGGTTSSDQVYLNVINGCRGKAYSVVLMHDSKGYTVDAVERIILWGLENGYTFLPLSADSPTCHHSISN